MAKLKKGITAHADYDSSGRWMLVIEKEKGRLTLEDIKAAARDHEWDYYLLVLDCFHDEDDSQYCLHESAGDRVTLYRTDILSEER